MIKKLLVLIFVLFIPTVSMADDYLAGEINGCSGELGLSAAWKCFLTTATVTGSADTMQFQIYDVTAGYENSIDIGVAVYSNYEATDQPYELIAYGCRSNFDFSGWSQYDWYSVSLPAASGSSGKQIYAGKDYWLCMWDESDANLGGSRMSISRCATSKKKAIWPTNDELGTCTPNTTEPWGGGGVGYVRESHGLRIYGATGPVTSTSVTISSTTSSIIPPVTTTTSIILECDLDSSCPDDGFYCNGEEFCDEENAICANTGNPCAEELICDEVIDECKPVVPPVTLQITPELWYQSRWVPLCKFLRIEGSDSHFDRSVTEITFTPESAVIMLPLVIDEATINGIGLLMPRWWAPVDSIDVTVTTGVEEAIKAIEIKLLPLIFEQEINHLQEQ